MVNWVSSGIKSFDDVIHGLRTGDNVVWQVDEMADYRWLVDSFVNEAVSNKRKLVYMRFAKHSVLVNKKDAVVYNLDAQSGFEAFSRQVHTIITKEGRGAYYVFDCLSDLLLSWATDLMIGNFFMVTCPYLFELDTIAYFAIERNKHSYKTIARIRETTQLLIDVYNCEGNYYIHPLKVWNRYSPTMFFPHIFEKDKMSPITDSVDTSRFFSHISKNLPDQSRKTMDYWDYLFMKVEDLIKNPKSISEQWDMAEHLCKIMMTNDNRMAKLIKKYFTLNDFLNIRSRIIGTGFIGGKTIGMLLARNILLDDKSFDWEKTFEQHDSFYVGSDVFYTYIVQNGWWRLWMEQKTKEGYFTAAQSLKKRFLEGNFPDVIKEDFHQVIDYFGQSPIIVRSSSIQEDAFGNAFAGKYESIFLCNQGTPEERYQKFVEAVKRIYSSTMNEDALVYRKQRGLDDKDEQMALLVQRVSGSYHDKYFFPFCAGVGVSNNIFIWAKNMDPKQGMLRLVFGLGTRAVNRVEGDYPRIVALDNPLSKPLAGLEDAHKYSQHSVDLLDTAENSMKTVEFDDILSEKLDIPLKLIAVYNDDITNKLRELGNKDKEVYTLNFDTLLKDTQFTEIMKRMLKTLENTYQYPIDTEFTLNFSKDGTIQINLLQCRPIQTKGLGKQVTIPKNIDAQKILLKSTGGFIGGNISQKIKRIIYVNPRGYYELIEQDKYMAARLVGKINKAVSGKEEIPTMLIGPGRWGTSTPSLGIPVSFSEINNVSVLCEQEFLEGNFSPDLSFGTHFFHDLIETGTFYIAMFSKKEGSYFNKELFSAFPDKFNELAPNNKKYSGIISVYDIDKDLTIVSDILSQQIVCYF